MGLLKTLARRNKCHRLNTADQGDITLKDELKKCLQAKKERNK